MSYGDIEVSDAPAITDAFASFLIESRSLALIAATVHEGTSYPQDPKDIKSAIGILKNAGGMIFAKIGDNFQAYLTDLMMLIFEKYPNTFYKRKYEARLAFESMDLDSLRRSIVEEQVGDLSYKSLPELNEFVRDSTGFQIFTSDFALKRTYKIMNIRNIVTHNRGVANSLFLSRDPSRKEKIGQKVSVPNFNRVNRYLALLARDIDHRACNKFKFDAQYLSFRKAS